MSDLLALLQDKSLKAKEKSVTISNWLLEDQLSPAELAQVAATVKEAGVADCLEGLEHATKSRPGLAGKEGVEFAICYLGAKAPRVKWEAARVIGNCIAHYPELAEEAIPELLTNTEHAGTVVRWSAAFALGEISKLEGKWQKELRATLLTISQLEVNKGVRKIYERALKAN
jgi:HEAT repeat protein